MNKGAEDEINKVNRYKKLFNSDDGKVILRDLLRSCNFFTGTFTNEHATMAYEEGRRSVVMDLLRTVQLDVDQIMNEYKILEREEKEYEQFN